MMLDMGVDALLGGVVGLGRRRFLCVYFLANENSTANWKLHTVRELWDTSCG